MNPDPDKIQPQDEAPEKDSEKESAKESLDSQWAEVLGIEFDEEEVRRSLPPLPDAGEPQQPATPPSPPYIGINTPGSPYRPEQPQQPQQPQSGQPFPPYSPYPPSSPSSPSSPAPLGMEQMPPTNLVWAILSMVLCCCIPGIIAVVYSSLVSTRFYAHDYDGSRRASRAAEIWIIISIVLGVVSNAIYIPFMLLGA